MGQVEDSHLNVLKQKDFVAFFFSGINRMYLTIFKCK